MKTVIVIIGQLKNSRLLGISNWLSLGQCTQCHPLRSNFSTVCIVMARPWPDFQVQHWPARHEWSFQAKDHGLLQTIHKLDLRKELWYIFVRWYSLMEKSWSVVTPIHQWRGVGFCGVDKQVKTRIGMFHLSLLRLIYMVQLCCMRYAYDKSTTRIVWCKLNLQLACDCCVGREECRGLLKHVLKPYDNRSDRQFCIMEIVYDFSMM